jgi:diadenosine tetraphosphate (Ap4A) HIT family hydrolase
MGRGDACKLSRRGSELRVSRWLLGANQHVRGYSVLVLDRHAIEFHDLSPDMRSAFSEDIADAGRTLARVLNPIKMNIEMQGNVVPHLHCHLKPRYPHDSPGHARIFQDALRTEIPLTDLERMAATLREQLR